MKELPHKAAQLRLSVGPPPCVFQHGGVEERAESTAFQAVVLSRAGGEFNLKPKQMIEAQIDENTVKERRTSFTV
jgi:hypothetical protein